MITIFTIEQTQPLSTVKIGLVKSSLAGKCQWGENFENFHSIGVPRLLWLARYSSLMQLAGQEAMASSMQA